jgi:site-specific DNA-methyltransferase (adenine-specific)
MPDNVIDCCVTSPPYYGLRDYGYENQLGLEETPELYVQKLVKVFREVKRVLKSKGTLWLNLGDSYASGKGTCYNPGGNTSSFNVHLKAANVHPLDRGNKSTLALSGLKPKDLIGIPWMVAFALRADGWYLRQDIIWNKPNPMPESVTDRCTKSHEYIFLLSKSSKYYYDAFAIATPYKDKTLTTYTAGPRNGNGDGSGLVFSENLANSIKERKPKQWKTPDGWDTGSGSHGNFHKEGREKGFKGYEHRGKGDKKLTGHSGNFDSEGNLIGDGLANKKSVWTIGTQSFPEAHFATFPEDLIVPCIKAGSPEGGIVYDPFSGAGTTAVVSHKLNRNWIGSEISAEYCKIAEKRIEPYLMQQKLF